VIRTKKKYYYFVVEFKYFASTFLQSLSNAVMVQTYFWGIERGDNHQVEFFTMIILLFGILYKTVIGSIIVSFFNNKMCKITKQPTT
jgi:hypothetical protein